MKSKTNVLIIGAGHMGLVLGSRLKASNIDYLILERDEHIGEQWRRRYKGLTLFTPNRLNRLPGFYIPNSHDSYLTKDEFAAYLSDFASHHKLEIKTNYKVVKITHDGVNEFSVFTEQGLIKAKQIVLATGAFKMPARFYDNDTQFTQLDLAQLQSMPFQNKRILVVGDGASGRQIAKQLSVENKVYVAQGKKRHLFPERILGIKTFSLLAFFGLLRLPKNFMLAKFLKDRDPFPDTNINDQVLGKLGVTLKPRVTSVSKTHVTFDGGEKLLPDIMINAIGYKSDLSFINIPALWSSEREFNTLAAEQIGLFQIGLPWQHNRASGLICGALSEAQKVKEKLNI